MSEKIDQIVENLKTLTLLEASELVTKIEETFGVDASASVGGGMVMAAAPAAADASTPNVSSIFVTNSDASNKVNVFKSSTI